MKNAQIACRAAWTALGLKATTGWLRMGCHDQCRELLFAGGEVATAYPSGLWGIYRGGVLLAEGKAAEA